MNLFRRSLLILLSLMLFGSCISPYDFETIGYERSLVIDASLTNETTAHPVRLSYTFAIDTSRNDPAERATVAFVDGSGNRTLLPEKSPGLYLTDSSFAGIPGMTYTLEISLPDGSEFRSSPEVMPIPVPIDSIYGRYLTLPTETDNTNMTGVQIFLDAHSNAATPQNFRYTYRESFETPVPYPSRYDWTGSGASFRIFARDTPLGPCYRKGASSTTMVATTRGLSDNRILEFPIRFINQSGQELAYRYIIEVSQYTISNEAHEFFRYLKESNEGSGSLSDRQLGSINGNIYDINDPTIPVLGYFEVAGVAKTKRIFSRHQFAEDGITTEEWICLTPDAGQEFGLGCEYFDQRAYQIRFRDEKLVIDVRTGDTTLVEDVYYDFSGLNAVLNDSSTATRQACGYTNRIVDIPAPGDYAILAHEACSDCTLYGTLTKPDIWNDQ